MFEQIELYLENIIYFITFFSKFNYNNSLKWVRKIPYQFGLQTNLKF
jgi:hypothetical protein